MSARSLSVGVQRLEIHGDPSGLGVPYVPALAILGTCVAWLHETALELLPPLPEDDTEALPAAMATVLAVLTGEIDPTEYNLEPRAAMVVGPVVSKLPGEGYGVDNARMLSGSVPFATTATVPMRRDGTYRASRGRMTVVGNIVDLPSMCRGNTYDLLAYANRMLRENGSADLAEDIREDMQLAERGQSENITSEVHVKLAGKRPRPVRTPKRDVWSGIPTPHAYTFTSCATLVELAHNFDGLRYVGHRPCTTYVQRPHSTKRTRKAEPMTATSGDELAMMAEAQALLIEKTGGAFSIALGTLIVRVSHKHGDQYRMRIGVKGKSAEARQVNVRAPQHIGAVLRNSIT